MTNSSVSATADVVREFWRLMGTNDFHAVAVVLARAFVLEWPQSRERIRGTERFARMNQEYPAHGPWRFTIHRLIAGASEAATDVSVTDGVRKDRAISFFTLEEGRILRIVEFWPEPFAAAGNRVHLVEIMGDEE
jgi:hypothetical protein